jgi:phenylpropionate dioxygenase-like ring-hydroxylating dioxygenase large terminal subunit
MTVAIDDLICEYQPGLTLPQQFYTDTAIFERDMECVFRKHWIFAGLETQIPIRAITKCTRSAKMRLSWCAMTTAV